MLFSAPSYFRQQRQVLMFWITTDKLKYISTTLLFTAF